MLWTLVIAAGGFAFLALTLIALWWGTRPARMRGAVPPPLPPPPGARSSRQTGAHRIQRQGPAGPRGLAGLWPRRRGPQSGRRGPARHGR